MINPKTHEEKFILTILNDFNYLKKVPDQYKNIENKQVILKIIERHQINDSAFLSCLSTDLRDDKDVVLAVIKKNGYALQYASKRLRDNELIVLEAVSDYGLVLSFVSDRLKDNKDIVMAAVNDCGNSIEYASKKLRNDKDIALIALKNDSFAFEYLSEDLKNDKEIATITVKSNGYLFNKLSSELKQDKELMREAYISKTNALKFFPEEVKSELQGLTPNQIVKFLEVLILKDSLDKESSNQENKPRKNIKL